ncbi:hypothetical protein Ato02nite_084150 [Paractinoplanes toevensis]|uniref:Uncharacterized protein n=1 Tax=Paractinoplanes toevensis TaxID=571911 RepID=A0A919WAG8_9ACTN|nr:hypothetical protein Ato02nite_084150 [Actinoplanes toevensis]
MQGVVGAVGGCAEGDGGLGTDVDHGGAARPGVPQGQAGAAHLEVALAGHRGHQGRGVVAVLLDPGAGLPVQVDVHVQNLLSVQVEQRRHGVPLAAGQGERVHHRGRVGPGGDWPAVVVALGIPFLLGAVLVTVRRVIDAGRWCGASSVTGASSRRRRER